MGTPTALRQTRAYLTGTSFANNTTGAITAQMIRQSTESGMGGYACINNAAGDGTPAVQAVANATTVTVDWSLGSSGSDVAQDTGTVSATTVGSDADFASDQIRIYDKGFFAVNCNLSIKQAATANIIWTAMISTDNTGGTTTDAPALKSSQYITNANDSGNFNMCGVIDTTAHTTYTDVYARLKHDNGSSQNMLLWFGQLMVYRIG
tara:strand:+ start:2860 stop:3480 length:621 start_codon:yes stop_codon:yes gene_type:complete